MKTLKLLLIISFGFNALLLFVLLTPRATADIADGFAMMAGDPCDDTHRYSNEISGGGREISPDAGKKLVQDFIAKVNIQNTDIHGGYISKRALDIIFSEHMDYNGILCFPGYDITSKTYTVVIEGYREITTQDNSTRTIVNQDPQIPQQDRFKVYTPETMCPTVCGYCGQ